MVQARYAIDRGAVNHAVHRAVHDAMHNVDSW
jgi:hypothetical protein